MGNGEHHQNKSSLQQEKTPKPTRGIQGKITLSRVLFVSFLITAVILLGFQNNDIQQPAPDFALADIQDNNVALSDYKGTTVLLEFMATWCPNCQKEISELKKISQSYGSQVVIISISTDPIYDTTDRLTTYVETHEISWSVCRDLKGVSETYAIEFIPSYILINKNQNIRWEHKTGTFVTSDTLSEQIARLL